MKCDWDSAETLARDSSVAFPDHLTQCNPGC